MIETAWAAARCRRSYFATQYHRLAARRGAKRAVVAVAHSILTVIYHLLRDGTVYQDWAATTLKSETVRPSRDMRSVD